MDEWSARRRDLYLTTYNTHNIQTSMSPVGFHQESGRRPTSYIARPLGPAGKSFAISKHLSSFKVRPSNVLRLPPKK